MSRSRILVAALLALAPAAEGQLLPERLPGVRVQLPAPVSSLPGASSELARDLRTARKRLVRDLVRQNRDVIEADPRGEPVVRGELLAIDASAAAISAAQASGFGVVRVTAIAGVGTITTLAAPPGTSTSRALRTLRRLDPAGTYDFNHIYMRSGEVSGEVPGADSALPAEPPAAGIRIGLVDGGIDVAHPAFGGRDTRLWGCEGRNLPSAHGTAVASLLVGRAGRFGGVVPEATLYAADVYCDQATGGNVLAILHALAWLAVEQVQVINVSLVGPPNAALERSVARLTSTGTLVVAAAGNDGPSAPPLFPAAYPGVIAVTGVDARNRVLIEACRGAHVAFAAPGADMAAAAGGGGYAEVRGTSFAAPIVAALLGRALADPSTDTLAARAALEATALDLGRKGRDDVYGIGLVGSAYRVSLAQLGAR